MKGSIAVNSQIIQHFFENAPEPFVLCDSGLNILLCNKACEDLLGIALGQDLGKKLTAIAPEFERLADPLMKVHTDGGNFFENSIAIKREDNDHEVSLSAFRADGFIAILLHPTSIAELQLKEINQVNQHAFRTLRDHLTALLGWNTMAQRDVAEETAIHYLKHIDKEALKASQIIGELLDLETVRNTQRHFTLISFERVIDQVIDKLKRKASFNKVFFTKDILYNQKFYCDKTLLTMIFSQLYDNALRFRRASVQTVVQTTIVDEKDGVQIVIEDNGKGISRAVQNDIVQLFYHTSPVPDTLGVGLYTVKNCLEQLNGKMVVESTPGKGTTFMLNIPNAFKEPKL